MNIFDINFWNVFKKTLPFLALAVASIYIISWLLTINGHAPSLLAASKGVNAMKIIDALTVDPYLDRAQPVELFNINKIRPLTSICGTGDLEAVEYLIKKGYKVEEPSDTYSCVALAVYNQKYNFIEALHSRDHISDKQLNSSLELAIKVFIRNQCQDSKTLQYILGTFRTLGNKASIQISGIKVDTKTINAHQLTTMCK